MVEDNKGYNFTITDDNGIDVKCDVIGLLQDGENNELYVLFTDNRLDKDNNLNVCLAQLIIEDGKHTIKFIDDEKKFNYLVEHAQLLYGEAVNEILNKDN